MANRYVPGAPNPYFPKHQYFGVKLGGNMYPLSQAKVAFHVDSAARAKKAIETEMLTAEHLWVTFQKEAEAIVLVNGQPISDVEERNRRINAAHARLWLADNRFQWAGLAAFASKQTGCGLLHAGNLGKRQKDELQYSARSAGNSSEAAAISAMPTVIRNGADFMFERLGYGNLHLFLDIYPLHRFYMERGLQEFEKCLERRKKIANKVYWDDPRKLLEFGQSFAEIRKGFELIEAGGIANSVDTLARHEQVNVLQAIMYDDERMQRALAANQFAFATKFPSGVYNEIQLTLSAECRVKPALASVFTAFFSGERNAKLWVADERMAFVRRAASKFDQLLRGSQRSHLEASILAISAGGGVSCQQRL
ncbi:hypothetical protein MasN3_14370 [Massilia varians]|uniref:Uncharacterized protein n=1 Tax=Massilia varians TaxID=457921 RepID=A0ABN6T6R7_9BURK|nr:hypothetical protein [Massilia varians]BDT57943.1 hypothetical protein MasN3_14370 [Massilia varians]